MNRKRIFVVSVECMLRMIFFCLAAVNLRLRVIIVLGPIVLDSRMLGHPCIGKDFNPISDDEFSFR